jgi:hypothetical protein
MSRNETITAVKRGSRGKQCCGSGFKGVPGSVTGSGSERAKNPKTTQKNRKLFIN